MHKARNQAGHILGRDNPIVYLSYFSSPENKRQVNGSAGQRFTGGSLRVRRHSLERISIATGALIIGVAVGEVGAFTLEQAVAFHFTEIVAELIQSVGVGGEAKAGEIGVVDFLGRPTSGVGSGVKENFRKADNEGRVSNL